MAICGYKSAGVLAVASVLASAVAAGLVSPLAAGLVSWTLASGFGWPALSSGFGSVALLTCVGASAFSSGFVRSDLGMIEKPIAKQFHAISQERPDDSVSPNKPGQLPAERRHEQPIHRYQSRYRLGSEHRYPQNLVPGVWTTTGRGFESGKWSDVRPQTSFKYISVCSCGWPR